MTNRKTSRDAAKPGERAAASETQPEVMLRTCDLARAFGVDQTTILRWCSSMSLPAHRLPSGHRRFKLSEVQAWYASARDHAAPEPADERVDAVSA